MSETLDYTTAQTGNILVSACHELLASDSGRNELWAYVLRIENLSDERIRLIRKDICLTDVAGNSRFLPELGFNGELPDLAPGEYYEFEDTTQTNGASAVLYGSCSAVTLKGKELKIKLPLITLSSKKNFSPKFIC